MKYIAKTLFPLLQPLALFTAVTWLLLSVSCKKDTYVGKNPYADAKEPLTIELNTTTASPATGAAGTTVELTGKDFEKYKDSGLVVKFNEQVAAVKAVSDTHLTVTVPEYASTGLITLTVLNQVFPGPYFRVRGLVNTDTLFHSVPGADGGSINCIEFVPGGKYLIGGSFTEYDNSGFQYGAPGIARINEDGSIDRSFTMGKGVQGSVNTATVLPDGKYIIGGSFSNYNDRFKDKYISNITRLNTDGTIDSTIINTGTGKKDTIPSLNAYFDGPVTKILQTPDSGKIIIIGSFNYYMRKDFAVATMDGLKDSVKVDSIRMEGLVRLNKDGSFDSAFNYDTRLSASPAGFNGQVYDGFLQNDGKIVLAGNFTKYHDRPAGKVIRLNIDGSPDPDFALTEGPDERVYSIALSPKGQYLISGQFTKVNGTQERKIALLDKTGHLVSSFSAGKGTDAGPDGIIRWARYLKNGKIFVSGNFQHFSGIKRQGNVILEPDGSVSPQFNNLGALNGTVYGGIDLPNENATILVGNFDQFDLKTFNRILLLRY